LLKYPTQLLSREQGELFWISPIDQGHLYRGYIVLKTVVKFTVLLGCFSQLHRHGQLANPSRGFSIPGVEPDGVGLGGRCGYGVWGMGKTGSGLGLRAGWPRTLMSYWWVQRVGTSWTNYSTKLSPSTTPPIPDTYYHRGLREALCHIDTDFLLRIGWSLHTHIAPGIQNVLSFWFLFSSRWQMRGSSCKDMKMLHQRRWITEDVQSGGIPPSCPQEEQDYHYGWSMERFSNLPSFAGRRGNASHAPLGMIGHEIAVGLCRRPFFNAQNNQTWTALRPPEEHQCRPRPVLQMFTIWFLFRDVKGRQKRHKREEKRRNL